MNSDKQLRLMFPRLDDVPEGHRLPAQLHQRNWLSDGELRCWDGPVQDVVSPIRLRSWDGLKPEVIGSYPLLEEEQALESLAAAVRAYDNGSGLWPTMSVADRIQHVCDFVERMKQHRDAVVRLLMWEIAKDLNAAEKEFDRTVAYIIDTVDALKEMDRASSRFQIADGIVGQIRRAPLGVVLCMGPFNYPLNETFTTLLPALIMGNTVVFKPPKMGVLLHQPLLDAFREAFPPGVVNTVYGEGQKVIGPMMRSGDIACLAFIGSSRVADILKQQHPKPHRLRCVLGLEAKNAAVILPSADLDTTVRECVIGALSYNGQRCTALKILFVHRSIQEMFLARFVEAVEALTIGMPWTRDVHITPLPDESRVRHMHELVDDAVRHGAEIINAGGQSEATLFRPAIVFPTTAAMRLYREEQFGPVIPVLPFDDVDEPVRYIRDSEFGQQVSIFGRNPDQIGRLIDPLVNQVCRVNINSQCQRGPDSFPFTGRKASAEGTLSVSDALRVFGIRTLVAARLNEMNKELIQQIIRGRKSAFLTTDFLL